MALVLGNEKRKLWGETSSIAFRKPELFMDPISNWNLCHESINLTSTVFSKHRTSTKGRKIPVERLMLILNCQGTPIVTTPVVVAACLCLTAFRKTHSDKGNCYTAWKLYTLLNESLLQQPSAVLIGWYQYAAYAFLKIIPTVWTN